MKTYFRNVNPSLLPHLSPLTKLWAAAFSRRNSQILRGWLPLLGKCLSFIRNSISHPAGYWRLDTRTGAEEIIERLHGRVVRGWNDNGCRISVRFADTNEQRELRVSHITLQLDHLSNPILRGQNAQLVERMRKIEGGLGFLWRKQPYLIFVVQKLKLTLDIV